MALFEFSLGLTADAMTNLEDLGGSDEIIPYWTYSDPEGVELANGHTRLLGFPLITWHWGFISAGDLALLYAICTEKSVDVFVRTPINERSSETVEWRTFQAVMTRPAGMDPETNLYKDVTIEFRWPVEQPEESI